VEAHSYQLGVDFGTSNTVAMLRWPGGQIRPLLFDGSPSLPSSVYLDQSAGLLVGRDAAHAARMSPERFEPNPKRRVDEGSVLLGDTEIGVDDVIAAVLRRVAIEAGRVAGGPVGAVTLTYPAAWAQTRRRVLLSAAGKAGLAGVVLVPEPIAAASSFVEVAGSAVPVGGSVVVYDLGAGTFDASVVRRGPTGFEVLAAEGLSQGGGLDIDAAVVGYLGAVYAGRDPALWGRLTRPATTADRRANRLLWEDVRMAKEMLSRTSATTIHVPLADEDTQLGREQFEQLARPILDATVTATRAAIAAAGVRLDAVAGIFLVGGASRIPLVATLIHQAFGRPPTVVEQPELVVAEGSLRALHTIAPQDRGAAPVPPAPAVPPVAFGSAAVPVSVPPSSVSPSSVSLPVAPASGPPLVPTSGAPHGPTSGPPMSGAPFAPASGAPYTAASAPPYTGPPFTGPSPSAAPPMGPPHARPPVAGSPPAAPRRNTGLRILAILVPVVLLVGIGIFGFVYLNRDDGSGGGGDPDGSTPEPPDAVASDVTWSTNARDWDGQDGTRIQFDCPADGSPGSVWGTDLYTSDSSVCTAAVHAEKITLAEGGTVVIVMRPGESSYTGSERNGISTGGWESYDSSFEFST
jgi:actin-like ATPase involved in cell morphogenesis